MFVTLHALEHFFSLIFLLQLLHASPSGCLSCFFSCVVNSTTRTKSIRGLALCMRTYSVRFYNQQIKLLPSGVYFLRWLYKVAVQKSPRSRSHIFVKCMRTNPHMMKRNFDPVTRHAFSSTTISPRKRLIYNLFPDRQAILVKLLVQGRMGNKPKTLEQSGAP